jgi:hypothetical protein
MAKGSGDLWKYMRALDVAELKLWKKDSAWLMKGSQYGYSLGLLG